jgi:GxxExxY protein
VAEAPENGPPRRQGRQEPSAAADAVARQVVDAGLKIHKALGPGLLESVYETCLTHELSLRGLDVSRQVPVGLEYEGLRLDAGYRLDLLVGGLVIVEVKAVEALSRLHEAQLITYLKLSGLRVGLLINFNVVLFKDGVRRLLG